MSLMIIVSFFFFESYADHRDLHVLTLSFPTRRSSDLRGPHRRPRILAREETGVQNLDDHIGGQPGDERDDDVRHDRAVGGGELAPDEKGSGEGGGTEDRKSTRLNSSH